ncbi:hypothetical protein J7T55_010938 [Diaporthe amygdali]|uniref:uncharacterized protein n=1 Tax=Phomopsis amygdali TaxID=1214568 RepID=UPI0022FE3CB4|nr:uncharacterized protein J7T55_010938 [Diaporthe amygdali]KAJ0104472.1 hypothetical protein J7T55_010938 [Diaporthe amygdali]
MAPFLHRLLATLCILLFVLPALAVNASAEITEFHEGRVLTTYNLSADDLAERVVSFRLYPSLLGNSANKQTRIDSASRCGAEYDLPNQDKSTISSVYGSWIVPELIQRSEGVSDNPPLNWQWIVEWVGMDNVGTDGQSDHDCSLLEVGVLSLIYGNHENSQQKNTPFWAMFPQQQVPLNMEIRNGDSVSVNATVMSEKTATISIENLSTRYLIEGKLTIGPDEKQKWCGRNAAWVVEGTWAPVNVPAPGPFPPFASWILFNFTNVHAITSTGDQIGLSEATLFDTKQSDPDAHESLTFCRPVQMDSSTLEFYPY